MAAGNLSTAFRITGQQQVSAISALGGPSSTRASNFRGNSSISGIYHHELECTRSRFNLNVASQFTPAPRRSSSLSTTATRTGPASKHRHYNHATRVVSRAAGHVDKYGQCKCIDDALTSIMTDAIQHSLCQENDVMRSKVLDQMGRGLAALCRVSVGVAAESSNAPIPELSTTRDADLEQVQRLLHLTSLPFNSTGGEDFNRVMKLLQTATMSDAEGGGKRTLSESELSQVCERLRSDLVQCVGPLVMCFPELPLWAKHRVLLLPAEIAGKMAFSLLMGPNSRH